MTHPQNIGRYQILERLAAGGQGTVYRAWDTTTGEIIALKVLHAHVADNPDVVERFRREAELAASVSHPNVIRIFEVGQDGDQHFISMEYLPESIASLLTGQGGMPIERAVEICIQAAEGLHAASELGIIHRDVKPQNLLLAPDGTVKVTDFGIARATALSTMTRTGAVMGTPHYMSPEQAQGQRVDARSDIYAMGVVLYQLLTGRTPFEATTPFELMRKHVESAPPAVRLARPEVTSSVDRVVNRCLLKDPDDRYQSHAELADALRVAVGSPRTGPRTPSSFTPPSPPTSAPPDTPRSITPPSPVDGNTPPGSTAVTPSTPASVTPSTGTQTGVSSSGTPVAPARPRTPTPTPPEATPRTPVPATEPRRSNPWGKVAALLVVLAGVAIGAVMFSVIGLGGGGSGNDAPRAEQPVANVPPPTPQVPLPAAVGGPPTPVASPPQTPPPAPTVQMIAPAPDTTATATAEPSSPTPPPADAEVVPPDTPTPESTAPPPPPSDLLVSRITWDPPSPSVGNDVTFIASIENRGAGASQPTTVEFVPAVAPGRAVSSNLDEVDSDDSEFIPVFSWQAEPGVHTFTVRVDPENRVFESDETNNEFVFDYDGTAAADLVVHNITWEPINPSVGEIVTINVFTANDGPGDAPASAIRLQISGSDSPLGSRRLEPISNGEFTVTTFEWRALPGTFNFTATADPNDSVWESDEANNELSQFYDATVLADLVVERVTSEPSVPVAGQEVTFTVVFSNRGAGDAGQFEVIYYVNGDVLSHPDSRVTGLGSQQDVVQEFTWVAETGSHTFEVVVDSADEVVESDESNSLRAAVEVAALGDLVVERITWSPERPLVGDSVTFSLLIRNDGGSHSGETLVAFFKDGSSRTFGTDTVPSLAPGESSTHTFSWRAEDGSHTFGAIVDPDRTVIESDESNNETTVEFNAAVLPDLVVDDIRWDPPNPSEGDRVTFTVTVRNRGSAGSGISRVAYFVGDSTRAFDSDNIPNLAPGESATDSFNWSAKLGPHTFRALADSDDEVLESDETNNELTVPYDATLPPDLTISDISWSPQSPSVGDTVRLIVSVGNVSGSTKRTFNVALYVDGSSTPLDVKRVEGVEARSTADTTFRWSAEPGSHTFRAVADIEGEVSEINEHNNELTVSYRATVLGDLTVANVTWDPAEPVVGDEVTFSVTINNRGAGRAERSVVKYYLGSSSRARLFGSDQVNELHAGDSVIERFTWSAEEEGTFTFRIEVDADDHVFESEENNNLTSVSVTVGPRT